MSMTGLIDGYFGGAESSWILTTLGPTIDFLAEERARQYQRRLADAGAIPAQANP